MKIKSSVIETIFNKYSQLFAETCWDVTEYRSVFEEMVKEYTEHIIPEFFYTESNKGKPMLAMFQQIIDDQYLPYMQQAMVESIDVSVSNASYSDYFDGMLQFVNECMDLSIDGEASNGYREKVKCAMENDTAFIDSIFGGCNNPCVTEHVSEATRDIASLIDFMESLKTEAARCDQIFGEMEKRSYSDENSDLMLENVRMMCGSMNKYIGKMVDTVFTTYENIHSAISKPDPLAKKKRPEKGLSIL